MLQRIVSDFINLAVVIFYRIENTAHITLQ